MLGRAAVRPLGDGDRSGGGSRPESGNLHLALGHASQMAAGTDDYLDDILLRDPFAISTTRGCVDHNLSRFQNTGREDPASAAC